MLSTLSVVGSLAFVLLLLGFAMRALRRFSQGIGGGPRRLPLEVLQRVAVGPRQGIAVVRIGEKIVAVSVGDGGVRPVLELSEGDRAALALPVEPAAQAPVLQLPRADQFREVLKQAFRSAALGLAICVAAASFAAPRATAQTAVRPIALPVAQAAPAPAAAAPGVTAEQVDQMVPRLAPQIDLRIGDRADGGLRLSGTVGVVVMMGLLTLLPTLLLMMTSFTRILIVLHFLRQALGTQSAPPAHLLAALALLLTGFVMAPTFSEVNRTALKPWMEGQMEQGQMLVTAAGPLRTFMLKETRDTDLATFMQMSSAPAVDSADKVPLVVLISAFVTSELRTAFQIGFALFLPFIIIDLVVASVLMSMGMFMLPPAMIALPFKLLLFVLVDGWSLVVQGLVASFQ